MRPSSSAAIAGYRIYSDGVLQGTVRTLSYTDIVRRQRAVPVLPARDRHRGPPVGSSRTRSPSPSARRLPRLPRPRRRRRRLRRRLLRLLRLRRLRPASASASSTSASSAASAPASSAAPAPGSTTARPSSVSVLTGSAQVGERGQPVRGRQRTITCSDGELGCPLVGELHGPALQRLHAERDVQGSRRLRPARRTSTSGTGTTTRWVPIAHTTAGTSGHDALARGARPAVGLLFLGELRVSVQCFRTDAAAFDLAATSEDSVLVAAMRARARRRSSSA